MPSVSQKNVERFSNGWRARFHRGAAIWPAAVAFLCLIAFPLLSACGKTEQTVTPPDKQTVESPDGSTTERPDEPTIEATEEPASDSPEADAIRQMTLPIASARHRAGFAYVVGVPIPESEADGLGLPRRSMWRLYEDGILLDDGHDLHVDVETEGRGRYSHWVGYLVFSASDNTDPRGNGRTYKLVRAEDNLPRIVSPFCLDGVILRPGEILGIAPEHVERVTRILRTDGEIEELGIEPAGIPGLGIRLDLTGEYRVITDRRLCRALVVSGEGLQTAETIVTFAAAHTTGGTQDVPDLDDEAQDLVETVSDLIRTLFTQVAPLDLNCNLTSQLTQTICMNAGFRARPVWWVGVAEGYEGHIGVEVFVPEHGWTYYDPHFGVCLAGRDSAIEAWRLMNAEDDLSAAQFVPMVEKGGWVRANLKPAYLSLRTGLRLEQDGVSEVLLAAPLSAERQKRLPDSCTVRIADEPNVFDEFVQRYYGG